jgi:hypothetical protein
MNAFSLIQLILGIVEPALTAAGVIPTPYAPLAEGILAAIAAVKADLTNSNGTLSVNAATLMTAISSGLSALQTAGALPASWAGVAVALANAASAGTTAYEQSGQKVDPTQVQPIAPVA